MSKLIALRVTFSQVRERQTETKRERPNERGKTRERERGRENMIKRGGGHCHGDFTICPPATHTHTHTHTLPN